MPTKREYLVSLGLAKAGRGKFSNEAKAALEKALAEGMTFSDQTPPAKNSVTKNSTGKTEVKSSDQNSVPYVSPDEYRFPEDAYRAVGKRKGKRTVYSMREACNNCGYSLTNHLCASPSVLGEPVTIERA